MSALIIYRDLLCQSVDVSFSAGCLTQASHFISTYLQLVKSIPSKEFHLNCLLEILVRYGVYI